MTSGLAGAGFCSILIKSCAVLMVASADLKIPSKFPGGGTLLCQISVTLLFSGCIPYGICSAPWLVRCTSRFLHVVPMMFYLLAYRGLLLLSLAGLLVCGCSQIILIYVCKMIGRVELLISGVDSDLWFIAVLICPTSGGGSFYLRCIVHI